MLNNIKQLQDLRGSHLLIREMKHPLSTAKANSVVRFMFALSSTVPRLIMGVRNRYSSFRSNLVAFQHTLASYHQQQCKIKEPLQSSEAGDENIRHASSGGDDV